MPWRPSWPRSAFLRHTRRGTTVDGRELDERSRTKFERMEASPYLAAVVEAVRAYLDAAVADPVATERDRWSLSCLPSTFPDRLAAVSMKWMEVLVLNEPERPGDPLPAFVIVRQSMLDTTFPDRYPALEVGRSTYRDPGEDQVRVGGPHDELVRALGGEPLAGAARALAGDLMRSRTPYRRFHNRFLADAVLDRGPAT